MRKLSLCFFLMAFFTPFALADGSTTISRVIPSSSSSEDTTVSSRTTGAVSRNANASRTTTDTASRTTTDTTARTVAARSTTADSAESETSKDTVVRSGSRVINLGETGAQSTTRGTGTTVKTGGTVSRSVNVSTTNTARENLEATVNTVGRNARVSAASINNDPTVRRAGVTLRPSTAEVGGRATIAGTDVQTGSNIASEARAVQSRATTSADSTATAETIAEAQSRLEQTTSLNQSCQEQYNTCMDQFCSVIDSNQKRCSCSANLSNYAKVEEAVKDANTQLNEVAQRIRYVGLSADEIRAIMNATEAEEALSGTTDNTETRNMLEEIEDLIRDPTSSTSYSSSSTSIGLDMDLDFSSNSADLFNLDFLNTGTTSFSNLRGSSLYNAAKQRCNAVLTKCKAAGADTDLITGNYDLAIDKDCIAYEQGLTKMNETLVSNVRSANLMLQKARLAVLQNKNQYDAKGCIAALETCMTDDMVCGSDYTKCLDPTKRYIDENGEVILGQDITDITDFMQNYNNAEINSTFLSDAYNVSMDTGTCSGENGNNGSCNVKYLLQKIGTKQEVTDEGLCRAVLDKCQNYTYDSNGNYKPYNDVVVNYVQRAMVNIQAEQRQIISDYASNCMVDIATCYNQQVTQVNSWSSNASINGIYNVMRGACRNVALTCAYAVFAEDTNSCPPGNDGASQAACIEGISKIFYQSLLCPDNSTYTDEIKNNASTAEQKKYVNEYCKCNTNYEPWGTQCVAVCGSLSERNSSGSCVCVENATLTNGVCKCNAGFTAITGRCQAGRT